MTDLRLGDWRDVLQGVTCDALITDPPYSERTHAGQLSTVRGNTVNRITYAGVDEGYCEAFVETWAPRVRHWWVIFGDDITQAWWRRALEDADLFSFAAVPWIRHVGPRMTGDGPTSGAEQKPLDLMRAIVRDYSRPGWTVVDPHAGSGTTLLACALEGRQAIGAEQDAGRFVIAQRRLAAPQERSLFAEVARG